MTPRVVFTLQRGVTGRSDGSVERTSPPLTAIAAVVRPKDSRHGAGPNRPNRPPQALRLPGHFGFTRLWLAGLTVIAAMIDRRSAGCSTPAAMAPDPGQEAYRRRRFSFLIPTPSGARNFS